MRRVLAMALAVLSAPAGAQVERSGGGANAMLAQQYQQAVAEKTQLEADNQRLKSDLEAAKKEVEASKRDLATAKAGSGQAAAQLQAAQAANQSSQQSLEQAKAKMDDLIVHYRDTVATLKDVETDRTQLQQQLAQSKASYDQCAQSNADLYQVDVEVLDRYSRQGAFSYLARAEPFTRIERIRIDNLSLEYRQRADALKIEKADGVGQPAGGAATTPSKPR